MGPTRIFPKPEDRRTFKKIFLAFCIIIWHVVFFLFEFIFLIQRA